MAEGFEYPPLGADAVTEDSVVGGGDLAKGTAASGHGSTGDGEIENGSAENFEEGVVGGEGDAITALGVAGAFGADGCGIGAHLVAVARQDRD